MARPAARRSWGVGVDTDVYPREISRIQDVLKLSNDPYNVDVLINFTSEKTSMAAMPRSIIPRGVFPGLIGPSRESPLFFLSLYVSLVCVCVWLNRSEDGTLIREKWSSKLRRNA